MKETYTGTELEIIAFHSEDVITTSGELIEDGDED